VPIYAYKCSSCQYALDVLQKLSDAPLSVCPQCGAATFAKQLTAAGFQLKGSGWYATDFKNNAAKPAEKSPEKATGDMAAPATGEGAKAAAPATPSTGSSAASTAGANATPTKAAPAAGGAGSGPSGS